MWLSLIRMPSYNPIRWLVPPPIRTAYFSSNRQPGVVFRVSRTLAFVHSTAVAYSRVSVAIPLRR